MVILHVKMSWRKRMTLFSLKLCFREIWIWRSGRYPCANSKFRGIPFFFQLVLMLILLDEQSYACSNAIYLTRVTLIERFFKSNTLILIHNIILNVHKYQHEGKEKSDISKLTIGTQSPDRSSISFFSKKES